MSAVASRAASRFSAFTGATCDDAVAVAVKHDQRHFAVRSRRAACAHGGECRRGTACGAVGDPGMHSDRGIKVWVGRGHHRCHRAAGGESGDIEPVGVDLVVGNDLTGDAGDDRRLNDFHALNEIESTCSTSNSTTNKSPRRSNGNSRDHLNALLERVAAHHADHTLAAYPDREYVTEISCQTTKVTMPGSMPVNSTAAPATMAGTRNVVHQASVRRSFSRAAAS